MERKYLDSMRKNEGFFKKPYWDYKQWTSGYGTRAKHPGEAIDEAEAQRRFANEVDGARKIVDGIAPNAPEGVKSALTSLTFNAGDKWASSGLGHAIRRGDYQGAKNNFVQYNKAAGQTLPGLVNRRNEEVSWFDDAAPGLPPEAQAFAANASPNAFARDGVNPARLPAGVDPIRDLMNRDGTAAPSPIHTANYGRQPPLPMNVAGSFPAPFVSSPPPVMAKAPTPASTAASGPGAGISAALAQLGNAQEEEEPEPDLMTPLRQREDQRLAELRRQYNPFTMMRA